MTMIFEGDIGNDGEDDDSGEGLFYETDRNSLTVKSEKKILNEIESLDIFLKENYEFDLNVIYDIIDSIEDYYENNIDEYLVSLRSEYLDFHFIRCYIDEMNSSNNCVENFSDEIEEYFNSIKYFITDEELRAEFGDLDEVDYYEEEDEEYDNDNDNDNA